MKDAKLSKKNKKKQTSPEFGELPSFQRKDGIVPNSLTSIKQGYAN
jgi:hypothetical protein